MVHSVEITETVPNTGIVLFYSYFLSRDFLISLLVVTMFTTASYVFNLLQKKPKANEHITLSMYGRKLLTGLVSSVCISILIIGVGFYLDFNPALTIALGCIFGSNPELLTKLIKITGQGIINTSQKNKDNK